MGRKEALIQQYFNTVKGAVIADAVAIVQGPAAVGAPNPPDTRTLAAALVTEVAQRTALQTAIPGQITGALTTYDAAMVQPLATQAAVNTAALNTKAAASAVTALSAVVDTKAAAATVTALAGTVAGKADVAAVNTLSATVVQHGADIATATNAATNALAEANKRLLRAGDVATGSIMVPNATVPAAAPRFDQTFGGLNSPVRAAYGVGNTPTPMGPGPLTDPTPQGRRAQVIQIYVTMKTAPVLGLNVTVKVGTTPGGSEVYSKTYLLTALPGLGGLLQSVPTSLPDLPAGTVLYATVINATLANSPGTWDIIAQSYYKS